MTIDINKKYKTKSGKEVTLLSVEGLAPRPVVGYVDGILYTWTKDGKYVVESTDLVEVKPEPKFKVGEFLTDDSGEYCRVVSVISEGVGEEFCYSVLFHEGGPEVAVHEGDLKKP